MHLDITSVHTEKYMEKTIHGESKRARENQRNRRSVEGSALNCTISMHTEKSPIYTQKSPISTIKSLIHTQKSLVRRTRLVASGKRERGTERGKRERKRERKKESERG